MCLLATDRLFGGSLQVLHHLQVAQYYLDVLNGSDGVVMAPPPKAKRRQRRQDDGFESDAEGSDIEQHARDTAAAKRRPNTEDGPLGRWGQEHNDCEEMSEDASAGDSVTDAGDSAHNPAADEFPLEAW